MSLRKPASREINRAWLTRAVGIFRGKIARVYPPTLTYFVVRILLHRLSKQGPNADRRTLNVMLFQQCVSRMLRLNPVVNER